MRRDAQGGGSLLGSIRSFHEATVLDNLEPIMHANYFASGRSA